MDAGLLLLLVLAWAGQTALKNQEGPTRPPSEAQPTWQEQEAAVQQRIQQAMSVDRQKLEERLRSDPELMRRVRWLAQGLLLLLAASAFFFFRSLFRLARRRPIQARLGEPPVPGWGAREIFRLVVAVLALAQLAILSERLFIRALHPPWLDRNLLALANTLLLDAAVLAGAAWIWRRVKVSAPATSASPRGSALRQIGLSLTSYLAFLPVLLALLLAVLGALQLLGQEPSPQPAFTIYFSETRAWVIAGLVAMITLVGPAAEEVFFRGLLYGWLRVRWGIRPALGLSAVLFALLHGDPVAFVPILGLGLLFGWVYERSGSLLVPVAIHVLHNTGMLAVASALKLMVNLL